MWSTNQSESASSTSQAAHSRLSQGIAACILSVSMLMGHAHAKEVTQPYQGLNLNANLELAENKTLANGVILITHGGLAHYGMETIHYLQTLLKTRGYSSLAINLSLGLDNRHGMYDCSTPHRHRNNDAADEIGAWVNWLQAQGAQGIVLLGHSRGGAQTALYAAEHKDKRIQAVLLMASAIADNTSPDTYLKIHRQPLPPLLNKAKKLMQAGKKDTLLSPVGVLNCGNASATASTFVSYYGQDPRLDTPYLIPRIQVPVLVLVAGSDEVVVKLDEKLAALSDSARQHMKMKVIEGSDHTFRDLAADDAVDAIDAFLKNTVQPPKS